MPSYCAHGDVSAFLQLADFSGSTTPTATQIEAFIDLSEERIDQLTDHAWATARAKSVTDERITMQRVRGATITTRAKIQLSHYPVLAFSQHASPSLSQTNGTVKLWTGGKYLDYLDSDESKTMGSNVTDVVNKDFWTDIERGIIYISNWALLGIMNTAPSAVDGYISYKYATASTPDDIKLAAIYFTSSLIAMNDDLNLMQEGADSMNNQQRAQMYEEMGMKILRENRRIDRNVRMARFEGGFGGGIPSYPIGGV